VVFVQHIRVAPSRTTEETTYGKAGVLVTLEHDRAKKKRSASSCGTQKSSSTPNQEH
jgi:hypothetical protein